MKNSSLSKTDLSTRSGRDLRGQTEAKPGKQKSAAAITTEAATLRLVQELQIHQIELATQNEELVRVREETEAALRLFTDLYDFAPVGYFTLARDGAIRQANLTAARLLGVERGYLVKRRLGVFVPARSLETLNAFLDRIFSSGEKQACEIELLKAGSAPFWAHIEATTDSSDRETCRLVVVDITERKQAQEALRASEELFRNYLEYAPDGVYTNDLNGTFLYGNRKCEEIIGYKREEMIGKNFLELNILSEKSLNKAIELLQLNMEGKPTGPDEVELISKEGRLIPVEINTSVVQRGGEGIVLAFVRDITERKQAEETLWESEENFRLSLDDSPLGVRISTIDGETIYANRKILDIYSYGSIEELKKTPLKERYTSESYANFELRKEKRLRGEFGPSEYEISIVRKNGEIRHLKVFRKEVLWDGAMQFQVVYQDITARKEAEEALRNEHIMLARTEGIAQIGSWKWDVATDTVTWSDELFRIFQRDSRKGAPSFAEHPAFYHPDDMARLQQAVAAAVAMGTPYELELRAIRKDGETRVCMARGVAEMAPDGRAVHLFGSLQDITERKRAEESLKEKADLLKIAGEMAKLGGWSVDLKNNLCVWSDETAAIHERPAGYSPLVEEAISYYPPEWREKITKVFTQCAQNGIPYDEEMEIITANGRRVWVRTIGEPLKDESGKIIKVQGTFQDITERKRSEEALLNSREEMRSLSIRLQVAREEERIRIARKIHDEIGGLLTGLKIDLSLLLKTSLEIQDKTIKKSLLDGIESMIKSIDVSVPEIRRLAMELRPGVLDELGFVAAIEWHLHDFQKRTGITCQWISSVKYINVGIDLSTALFRIFQEALTNVARHSGATEVRAYLRAGEQSFVLEVEDNGKGFEKENLLSSESLGFMGMKERVQMFGGSVTITGKPGIGTKVTVNIPSMEKRKPDQEGDAG